MRSPFRYFDSSPEVIRLTAMIYVRYPLPLRQVRDLLFERGVDNTLPTVWLWWNRFGPMFAAALPKRRVHYTIMVELVFAPGGAGTAGSQGGAGDGA